MAYIERLRCRPIAIETGTTTKQRYEVGAGELKGMLGSRIKYFSCLYPKGNEPLDEADVARLQIYIEKEALKDGMKPLDLG
jgi:cyclopropane-fatty-acyl-phospholipid synthase